MPHSAASDLGLHYLLKLVTVLRYFIRLSIFLHQNVLYGYSFRSPWSKHIVNTQWSHLNDVIPVSTHKIYFGVKVKIYPA